MSQRKDPDLHNAISMRPSPFHAHPERSAHSPSPHRAHHQPPQYLHNVSSRGSNNLDSKPALSTAIASDGANDAHSRPVYFRTSSENERDDVERQGLPSDNDPYGLRVGKTDIAEEKEKRKANIKLKRSGACAPIAINADKLRGRKVIKFYEQQNENIDRMLKPVEDHVREAEEEEGADKLQFKIAVHGSFAANICLAILQIYGAVSSGSLSLFTTMADAIFDPCSNLTLILCNRAVKRVDPRRFPSGKGRLETAGNIAFCFLMTSVSLILIVESARELASGVDDHELHIPSVVAVGIAFVTKFCLFLYCWALRNKYSQVHILWEDHRNDLFINGFGLMTSVLGSKIAPWIDPMGAILLSVMIAFLWLRTAYQEFQLLIGVSADTSFLQHLTYISITHDPLITSIDTVRAYHSGPRLIVEVDVVMDRDRSLKVTHDVAEELQQKIESLPNVERAYVHVDYETTHEPEHPLTKKDL